MARALSGSSSSGSIAAATPALISHPLSVLKLRLQETPLADYIDMTDEHARLRIHRGEYVWATNGCGSI